MFSIDKKIQQLKEVENEEKFFLVAASYGVLSNTVGDRNQNKNKIKSFSPKVPEMQPIKNP